METRKQEQNTVFRHRPAINKSELKGAIKIKELFIGAP